MQSRGGSSLAYRGEKDGTPISNHDSYRKNPGLNPIHGTCDVTQYSKPPFKTIFLKKTSRKSISLIYTILGYKNNEEVDENLLDFLTHLKPTTKEWTKLNIYGFLDEAINQQVTNFTSLEVFRYPSYLFFLFFLKMSNILKL